MILPTSTKSSSWRPRVASAGEPIRSPLETAGGSRGCNGYCDYPFFEWLDRKYGPQAIRSVLDATATVNAQVAFENYRARWNRIFNVESDNLYTPQSNKLQESQSA